MAIDVGETAEARVYLDRRDPEDPTGRKRVPADDATSASVTFVRPDGTTLLTRTFESNPPVLNEGGGYYSAWAVVDVRGIWEVRLAVVDPTGRQLADYTEFYVQDAAA
jgi:hypothetical protein